MFYLIITVVLNVVISAIFKMFPRYGINALQAIVANYVVCVVTGSLFIGYMPFTAEAFHLPWVPMALLMGAGFISIFNLIAYCTRVDGITTATIANKLSLVIPVIFSFILYHERAGVGKVVGILLAFPAVYLTSRVKEDENTKVPSLFWPALLFVGSGLLDTLMNYVQRHLLTSPQDQALYTIFCFTTAGTIGLILITTLALLKKITLAWRNVVAGICVGIPNYFSIYYFIRALHSNVFQSSATIPVINIGILITSALTAILIFREQAGRLRIIGLVLSIIAILLITLGDK